MISLVVFLGNYGREYEKTRHNVAWIFEKSLPFADKLIWQSKFKGQYAVLDRTVIKEIAKTVCENSNDNIITDSNSCFKQRQDVENCARIKNADFSNEKVYFLKPETYMNLSGESIGALASFYKIKPEEILIIHDELELLPGTVSLKWSGGLGGHNGLRSAKSVLGTADFWRIRIGIGRPEHNDVAGYVLSAFSADERIVLDQVFSPLSNLLLCVLCFNPESLAKEWAKKKLNQ